jgi:predicted regulator of Ras-like GTPase activity (Roadblock/LC7/MglB family)
MNGVLSQLNGLPGVVGSLVCNPEGRVLAHAFPPVFDQGTVDEVARALTDGARAVTLTPEHDDLLDLRFREVRLLARPFSGATLAVLCGRSTNLQLVILSMGTAMVRLDKLLKSPAAPSTAQGPAEVAPLAQAPAARAVAGPGARRVAAPTKGLEELRRRLSEARDTPLELTPSGGFPLRKP